MVQWDVIRNRLNPALGVPLYIQLAEEIRVLFAKGYLTPGSRLPTVRELAASLTLNPLTVSRAYQELEQEGLVTSEVGRGTFVTDQAARLFELARSRTGKQLAAAAQTGHAEGLTLSEATVVLRATWEVASRSDFLDRGVVQEAAVENEQETEMVGSREHFERTQHKAETGAADVEHEGSIENDELQR
jgi:GntR family transcriptional regulator